MKCRPLLPLQLLRLRLPTRRASPPGRRSDSERRTDRPPHPRPLQGRGFFFPSLKHFASPRVHLLGATRTDEYHIPGRIGVLGPAVWSGVRDPAARAAVHAGSGIGGGLVVGQPENTSEREDTRVIFVHKGATTNGPPQTIDRPHPGSESGPPTAPLRWCVGRFLRFTIGVGLLGLPIWFLMF